MKYPAVSYQERAPDLVDRMITNIADIEWRFRPVRDAELDPYPVALAQDLVSIGHDHDAMVVAQQCPENPSPEQLLYNVMWKMVQYRRNPDIVARRQRDLHMAALNALGKSLQTPCNSFTAEYVCLSLLTRYAHPDMVAFPTLSHHEMSTTVPNHYDVGVIMQPPQRPPQSYYLQVKAICLGACDGPRISASNNCKVDAYREKYRTTIQLVSSCCDLGIRSVSKYDETVIRSLFRERKDRATDEEVATLDKLTDQLVFKMSADLLPRGERLPLPTRDS